MSKVNDIFKQFNTLNKNELEIVSEKLLQLLQNANGVALSSSESISYCKKCNSRHIIKFGKDAKGNQRYKCNYCGATFTKTSGSVVSKTQHPIEVWEKYLELLLQGATLAVCAEKCGISIPTAFVWRHKILSVLQKDQDNRVLAGIIEVDELYVSVSYKGNHKKSVCFEMPRKAYRRGGDNRNRKEAKACVLCAVERNGQTYAEVVGTGQPTIKMLKHSFSERLLPDSLVVSDKSRGLRNFFNNHTTLELIQILAKREHNKRHSPPEIKGIYHVQNVNSLHKRFRYFIRKYNGVATKYLNHYVNLFIWIENHRKIVDVNIEKEFKNYISDEGVYISGADIIGIPAIPCVA